MIAILAGNRRQFDSYIQEHNIDKKEAVFVGRGEDLYGREFTDYRAIGTWHQQPATLLTMWEWYRQNRVQS